MMRDNGFKASRQSVDPLKSVLSVMRSTLWAEFGGTFGRGAHSGTRFESTDKFHLQIKERFLQRPMSYFFQWFKSQEPSLYEFVDAELIASFPRGRDRKNAIGDLLQSQQVWGCALVSDAELAGERALANAFEHPYGSYPRAEEFAIIVLPDLDVHYMLQAWWGLGHTYRRKRVRELRKKLSSQDVQTLAAAIQDARIDGFPLSLPRPGEQILRALKGLATLDDFDEQQTAAVLRGMSPSARIDTLVNTKWETLIGGNAIELAGERFELGERPSEEVTHGHDAFKIDMPVFFRIGVEPGVRVANQLRPPELVALARERVKEMASLHDVDVVAELPDGFRLVQLRAEQLAAEGRLLGHCVADYADAVQAGVTEIYSIRKPDGRPAFTIEKDAGGEIVQYLGQSNRRPGMRQTVDGWHLDTDEIAQAIYVSELLGGYDAHDSEPDIREPFDEAIENAPEQLLESLRRYRKLSPSVRNAIGHAQVMIKDLRTRKNPWRRLHPRHPYGEGFHLHYIHQELLR